MNTLDHAELDHFRTLNRHWWDEDGPFRMLHQITPLRVAFLRDKATLYFGHSLKGLRILDVGCGGGILCEPLVRLGAVVTGIDPVEESIAAATEHAALRGLSIDYRACALEDLPPETFDIIIASEIIEHVNTVDDFLEACYSHLDARGAMFLSTLNRTLSSYLFAILAAENVLGWVPAGTHSWEKFISPRELSQKLNALGLSQQETSGLSFCPFRRTWRFSSNMEMNYLFWANKSSIVRQSLVGEGETPGMPT